MKKLLFATLLLFCAYNMQATENSEQTATSLLSQASTYYEGPAWSTGGDGLIPSATDSINIKWSSEGLWINGNRSDLRVTALSGGQFPIKVNGRLKYCTHYVNYGGEKYFFEI